MWTVCIKDKIPLFVNDFLDFKNTANNIDSLKRHYKKSFKLGFL